MLSRGFDGAMPGATDGGPSRRQWLAGLAPAGVAVALAAVGWSVA
jgi:hypothetical protein